MILGLLYEGLGDTLADKKRTLTIERIYALAELPGSLSFEEKIDHLRKFVHDNSDRTLNEEFYTKWENGGLENDFLNYLEKRRQTPPPMECTTRSGLLGALLRHAGYTVRDVVAYNVNNNLSSHTFIEILNPDTGEWVAQDPDFNMIWRNKRTREPVSFAEVLGDIARHQPCLSAGCGWKKRDANGRTPERFRDDYQIASFIDRDKNERFTVYAPAFKPDTIFHYESRKATFCELIEKNCRDGFFASQ